MFYLIENISIAYIFKKSLSIPPNLIKYSLFIFANVHPVLEYIHDLNGLHLYPSNLSNVLIPLSSISVDEPPHT